MERSKTPRSPSGASILSPQEALKESTIVLVDDEPTTLDILETFLEAEGYRDIVKVEDSTEALETMLDRCADVVLLDLMMPGVSGLEILRAMGDDEDLSAIPVIVFSSTSDSALKLQALELGAADFLAKPVDPSELALRVRNTLAYKAWEERFGQLDNDKSHQFIERIDRALRGDDPPIRSRLAGDPRFQPTIEKFVRRLDEKLEWMLARFDADDFDELATLAHWLKGSAGMVGFDAFTGPADTLEILAKEGKRDEAAAVLRELHTLAERISIAAEET